MPEVRLSVRAAIETCMIIGKCYRTLTYITPCLSLASLGFARDLVGISQEQTMEKGRIRRVWGWERLEEPDDRSDNSCRTML